MLKLSKIIANYVKNMTKNEFSIIDLYFKPLTNNNKIAKNLSDDTASFCVKKDEEIVVSKDLIVEDVHFLRKDGAKNIAAKLLLSNLSDIAASGAEPIFYMLGFSKNNFVDKNFLEEFCSSLKEIQDKFKIFLAGGDTVLAGDKLFFSITIFGKIKKNKILSRNNAKNGDLIFVSGNVGDAYLGLLHNLEKIKTKDEKYFLQKFFNPQPRIELGKLLVKEKISKCAIDVSDGFFADLKHICQSSNLDAIIFKDKIPFSKPAKKLFDKIDFCDLLSGGEDYELIFSVHKKNKNKILKLAKKLKIELNYIGFFKKTKSAKIIFLDEKNQEIKIKKYGYEH